MGESNQSALEISPRRSLVKVKRRMDAAGARWGLGGTRQDVCYRKATPPSPRKVFKKR
jgi:hypothetical protein